MPRTKPVLLLATTSAGKIREIREMTVGAAFTWCGLDELPSIDPPVEDGVTFQANATKKALYYAERTGRPALADDSGLEVDCLDGAPGVHSAYYAGEPRDDEANNRKLVAALRSIAPAQRTARFRCHMVFASGGRVLFEAVGAVEGVIVEEPRGANGFGYDPHFWLPSLGKTTAELAAEQKNAISHRGKALREMVAKLTQWFAESPGRDSGPAMESST